MSSAQIGDSLINKRLTTSLEIFLPGMREAFFWDDGHYG